MNKLFFNEMARLRAGWRAVFFLVVFIFVSAIPIFAALELIKLFSFGQGPGGYLPLLIPFTFSTVAAVLLGWLFGKKLEGVAFSALGCSFSKFWLRNLAFGCVIGAVAFCSAVIIAVMSGGMNLTINRTSATSAIAITLLTTLVIFAAGAASEETLFRGYLLQTFTREKVFIIGVAFTSLLFSFAHNGNPAANLMSSVNTLLAGIWFAAAYLKTRDLWFPFGVHLAWNWLQGPVFGINVSGIAEFSPDPVLRATDIGPAWLTGGSYGIEGGIACTIALIISIGLIYYLPGLKSEPPA
jgi:membrane protease YdiL (CAAX protease family)